MIALTSLMIGLGIFWGSFASWFVATLDATDQETGELHQTAIVALVAAICWTFAWFVVRWLAQ